MRALLERHLAFARDVTPRGQVHALEVHGLVDLSVTFFSARRQGHVVGVAALKQLDTSHAEIKSMHTAEAARGQGVATALLDHLLAVAASRHYRRVSLETGTTPAFGPACALYTKAGFTACEPFGEYARRPHGRCLSLELGADPPSTTTRGLPTKP